MRRLRAKSSQKRREVGFLRARARSGLSTRWKASWVVGGSPFTGGARGGLGRTGESEARALPIVRWINACSGSGESAWSRRVVPVRRQGTSEIGTSWFRLLQCAARATRGVSIRGVRPARPCDVQMTRRGRCRRRTRFKGRAGTMVRSKRARANSAAHLPRSRQRELFWTGLGSHTKR